MKWLSEPVIIYKTFKVEDWCKTTDTVKIVKGFNWKLTKNPRKRIIFFIFVKKASE